MRAAVPAMERVGGGSIILVSSIWGKVGTAGATAYQATKVGGRRLLAGRKEVHWDDTTLGF
jgi:cyclopentanol dehydrogenase